MKSHSKLILIKTGLIIVSLLLISSGIFSLLNFGINSKNYWGGIIFTPLTLIAGIIVLFLALFKFNKFYSK